MGSVQPVAHSPINTDTDESHQPFIFKGFISLTGKEKKQMPVTILCDTEATQSLMLEMLLPFSADSLYGCSYFGERKLRCFECHSTLSFFFAFTTCDRLSANWVASSMTYTESCRDSLQLYGWCGPYKIEEKLGKTDYVISTPDRQTKFHSYLINLLNP